MSETGLVQIIEGALLAAGKPMTVAQLAELFEEQERPDNALDSRDPERSRRALRRPRI